MHAAESIEAARVWALEQVMKRPQGPYAPDYQRIQLGLPPVPPPHLTVDGLMIEAEKLAQWVFKGPTKSKGRAA